MQNAYQHRSFSTKLANETAIENRRSRCKVLVVALALGLIQSGIAIWVIWQLLRAGS